jgi:hypothetical protein
MSDEPTIRPYRAGDEHGIVALFNRVFAIGNPDFVPRPMSHWQWEFERNPEGQRTMVAVTRGEAGAESIVGTFTALPARFRFADGVFTLGQAVDTVIAPEHRQSLRKSGLYLRLATAWYETFGRKSDVRFLYGFPNPQAFRVGTRLSGYEPVRCPVLESSLPVATAAQWREESLEVEEVERFGGELGALDAAIAARLATTTSGRPFVAAVRDARAWNWRYVDHPTTRYRLLRAQTTSGRLRGFLVHGFSWHGFRKDFAPVVDWVVAPGDLATWRALLGDAARAAQRFSVPNRPDTPKLADLVAWATPSHPHFRDLADLGFTSAPTIFNLCIRRFPDSEYSPEEATERLVLTMGDSDIF